MNDQNEPHDEKSSNTKLINGAWIDVKLYTLKATKRQHPLSVLDTKKGKKIIKEVNEPSIPFYNELHYGNYE